MSAERNVQEPAPSTYPQDVNKTNERFSIDLSLELEHQLEDMESPPTHNTDIATSDSNFTKEKRESLDPHVLAHIIMQLRHSLAGMTKERDEVVKALSAALSKEAELNDALQLVTDKATGLEEELAETKKKAQEGEDAVALLRSKVEESRRGLMRLQTENRRQSGNFEAARGTLALSFGGNPPTPKRASFAPLTGTLHATRANGHKRISSVSDSYIPTSHSISQDGSSAGTSTHDFPSMDAPPGISRGSGPFNHYARPQSPDVLHLRNDPLIPESESLKKELRALKDELENTRHHLSESNEAREASEMCVKALRDFIAENHIGVREVGAVPTAQLPPPPTMTTGDATETTHKITTSAGWGFGKLWKIDHGAKSSISSAASITSSIVGPTPQTPQIVPASMPTPLTKKLGGFFGSLPSISSSVTPPASGGTEGEVDQLQSNATLSFSHRGSIGSSDASSITEPVSHNELNPVVRATNMEMNEWVVGSRNAHSSVESADTR